MLVFPQINFTDEEQVAFTQTLGTLATESRGEQVYNVTLDTSVNKLADYLKGSLYWHLDGTMNEVPIFASLLASKVLPKTVAGTPSSATPMPPTRTCRKTRRRSWRHCG